MIDRLIDRFRKLPEYDVGPDMRAMEALQAAIKEQGWELR